MSWNDIEYGKRWFRWWYCISWDHKPSITRYGFKTNEAAVDDAHREIREEEERQAKLEARQEAQMKEMRETWTIETWLDGDVWAYNANQMWGEEGLLGGSGYRTRQSALEFAKRAIDQVMTKSSSHETETYRWEES